MKRLILILVVLLAAGSLLAGEGKSCDMKKSGKTVELTGTLAADSAGHQIFRVADSNQSYTVCHKTSAKAAKVGANGATIQVTGKLVACDEAEGEELVIETAKKV